MEEPNHPGLVWLLLAKVVCCGGILLAATGALSLSSLASWLFDSGGLVWLVVAVVALMTLYFWRRFRPARPAAEHQYPQPSLEARHGSHAGHRGT